MSWCIFWDRTAAISQQKQTRRYEYDKLTKLQLRADTSKQKLNNNEQNYSRRFLLTNRVSIKLTAPHSQQYQLTWGQVSPEDDHLIWDHLRNSKCLRPPINLNSRSTWEVLELSIISHDPPQQVSFPGDVSVTSFHDSLFTSETETHLKICFKKLTSWWNVQDQGWTFETRNKHFENIFRLRSWNMIDSSRNSWELMWIISNFSLTNVSKMNHVSFDLSVLAPCGGVQV